MLTRDQVQSISNFRSRLFPVLSFYLNVNSKEQGSGAYKIAAKDLTKEVKGWLKANEDKLAREQIQSVNKDIVKYLSRVSALTIPFEASTHVVFACNGEGFWEELFLPRSFQSEVKISVDPFVRYLTNTLDQCKRYALCMVDRSRGCVAEVYMHEIMGMEDMSEEVPKKVRTGGWQGYSEARIKRHVDEHIFEHLKHVAAFMHDFLKTRKIDRVIISAPANLLGEFEDLLPEKIMRKIVRRRGSDAYSTSKNDILRIVREVDDSLRLQNEKDLVKKTVDAREKGGNAATGLYEVLRSLNQGAVNTLIVAEGYAEKGFRCLSCNYLSTVEEKCPFCNEPMNREEDIVDELIEVAISKGAEVIHLHTKDLFSEIKNIGALLRFRPEL